MSKNKKTNHGLGRSLIKNKYKNKIRGPSSMLHTSELNDGQDWSTLNAQSITDQSHVEAFLDIAELAGNTFKAEKLNIKFISSASKIGVLSAAEKKKILQAQEENRELLRIPRRPDWDRSMDAADLARAEHDSFLVWRRTLAQLQDKEGLTLTPYEKNLNFWRQLWRVVERSDLVVQIVDARNPLMFYCPDLSYYVSEMGSNKENLILINKADFLTEEQRKYWLSYFREKNLKAVFYSALQETLDTVEEESEDIKENLNDEIEDLDEINEKNYINSSLNDSILSDDIQRCLDDLEQLKLLEPSASANEEEEEEEEVETTNEESEFLNSFDILNNDQLIEIFRCYHPHPLANRKHVVVGLVGYPNVGKSSTINCLLQQKKTSVSATPGKTKHFQTLFLNEDILLCDCPGLVFPGFVSSREEMILSGILPIDQMRDHVPPVNLLLSLMPRTILEDTYGIAIPPPIEGEDPNRPPISEEFLNVYGYMRGFMTPRGIPDHPRSARYVLKDFMDGRLLHSHAPPTVSQEQYHIFVPTKIRKRAVEPTAHQKSATMSKFSEAERIDKEFLQKNQTAHFRGNSNMRNPSKALNSDESVEKPWRVKTERKKKEKARRKFAHLDY